jgi:NAD+ diphosphatase
VTDPTGADTTRGGAAGFQLAALPTLSRSTVDRDEPLRDDTHRLLETWPQARVIVVDDRGRTEIAPGGTALRHRPASDFGDRPPEHAVLLGEQDGVMWWALPGQAPDSAADAHPGWGQGVNPTQTTGPTWFDLRAVGALLDDTGAGLFTTAVSLLNWHRHAGFCAVCGAPTEQIRSGWARHCTGCGREEYPRTDAAMICLVHDGGDLVLLARQPTWPADRYSILAGFLEAGESLEACVAREVAEEVGLAVHSVRYLGSQPWPFPRSIMIGFSAVADPKAPLKLADGEIEDAKWVAKAQVRQALAAGGALPGLILPGGVSIANRMLEAWAGWPPPEHG